MTHTELMDALDQLEAVLVDGEFGVTPLPTWTQPPVVLCLTPELCSAVCMLQDWVTALWADTDAPEPTFPAGLTSVTEPEGYARFQQYLSLCLANATGASAAADAAAGFVEAH